jgi:DNA-binding cell septation regulator SpoVG
VRIFQGLQRSDYQDVLRALGYLIDERGYVDIRIIESEEGLVFQGRMPSRQEIGEYVFDTFLITDEEIKDMVRASYRRRRQKPPAYSNGNG